MEDYFSPGEIFQFAINTEKNGEEFYRLIAQKFKDEKIKAMFNYLADEESEHRSTFQDMVSEIDNFQPSESYTEEYFLYLKALADEIIFTKEKKGELMAGKIDSAKEAIDFGIGIERDSIHYYLEAKNLVPQEQKQIIDKIIKEEREHYLKFLKLKEEKITYD